VPDVAHLAEDFQVLDATLAGQNLLVEDLTLSTDFFQSAAVFVVDLQQLDSITAASHTSKSGINSLQNAKTPTPVVRTPTLFVLFWILGFPPSHALLVAISVLLPPSQSVG